MRRSLKALVMAVVFALVAAGFAVAMPLAVQSITHRVAREHPLEVERPDAAPIPITTPTAPSPPEVRERGAGKARGRTDGARRTRAERSNGNDASQGGRPEQEPGQTASDAPLGQDDHIENPNDSEVGGSSGAGSAGDESEQGNDPSGGSAGGSSGGGAAPGGPPGGGPPGDDEDEENDASSGSAGSNGPPSGDEEPGDQGGDEENEEDEEEQREAPKGKGKGDAKPRRAHAAKPEKRGRSAPH